MNVSIVRAADGNAVVMVRVTNAGADKDIIRDAARELQREVIRYETPYDRNGHRSDDGFRPDR